MFGSFGKSLQASSVSFVSKAAAELGLGDSLGLSKETIGVSGTRTVTKKDMVLNDYMPEMSVDPETYEVRADGQLLICEPAKELPMAQRYFLF
jgi:urease subunit alpha